MQERSARGAKRWLTWLLVPLMAIAAIYVVVQLVVIFHRPYKTETAILYSLSESVTLSGVAAFDTVTVEGGGDLGYLVGDGERVTSGAVIAERYTDSAQGLMRERIDRLARSIDLLKKSENSSGSDLSVLTRQTRQSLYNLLDRLDTAQYSGIVSAQDDFLLAQNRLQISTAQVDGFSAALAALQTEYSEISAELAGLDTIVAPTNGYFTSADASPNIEVDAAALAQMQPAELKAQLEAGFPAADKGRAGRITTGFSWRFYAVCDLETAARFDGLKTVGLSIPGRQNEPLRANVEQILRDEEQGIAKIVLECPTINANVLGVGLAEAKVDLSTYEGLRIDKNALHIVDGARGVYVKYGNLQRFLKITVLYENDQYLLVPADGAPGKESEVRLYDEIIVSGSNLQDGKLL